MREYGIEIDNTEKNIYDLGDNFKGYDNEGNKLEVTNYYFKLNEKLYFIVSGEFHFSRYDERYWEKEIVKMKMSAVNTIATYVFWNHHEETKGKFVWSCNRNLRRFIELCKMHHMYVILRVGPFAHGEVRNGGLPDWLYGMPFELRSNNEEYLYYVDRLY